MASESALEGFNWIKHHLFSILPVIMGKRFGAGEQVWAPSPTCKPPYPPPLGPTLIAHQLPWEPLSIRYKIGFHLLFVLLIVRKCVCMCMCMCVWVGSSEDSLGMVYYFSLQCEEARVRWIVTLSNLSVRKSVAQQKEAWDRSELQIKITASGQHTREAVRRLVVVFFLLNLIQITP